MAGLAGNTLQYSADMKTCTASSALRVSTTLTNRQVWRQHLHHIVCFLHDHSRARLQFLEFSLQQ
eukprot:364743-Chlamydomonas_euryale.AAC.105